MDSDLGAKVKEVKNCTRVLHREDVAKALEVTPGYIK